MANEPMRETPEQTPISWGVAFAVSWGAMRRRFLRMLITMIGVILAIAFLTYMLISDDLTRSLIAANDARLNILLQQAGVNIFSGGGADRMTLLLIGLSLLTCLVGIVNSMLMSVAERVREIGTLKCLGALDSFIVKTYFIESSLQGILGTLIGIGFGAAVTAAVAAVNYGAGALRHFPVLAALGSVGITFLVGSLISVLASIAPAYMAARKEPVDAMRIEE